MEHGSVVHAEGQIGGTAAAAVQRHVHGAENALGIEADAVVDAKIMALAGHDHVVVAVETDLGRPTGLRCGKGCERGPLCRLGFLAAKAAAHAPALAGDVGVGAFQHSRHAMLDLGRVLGGTIDGHGAAFMRNGERDLALEVEVLLAADRQATVEAVAGAGERGLDVTAQELVGGKDFGLRFERIFYRQNGTLFGNLDLGKPCGAARGIPRFGENGEDHLAVKFDLANGENGIVVKPPGGTAVVEARDIGRGEHKDDARGFFHRVEIEPGDAPAGAVRGIAGGEMQRALGFELVVDIDGGSGDMAGGAVVRQRLAHDGLEPWNGPARD
jgi:hypothetical protein